MYNLPIYPRDRSPIRALIFIPALIVIGVAPAMIAWIMGSALGGGLELVSFPAGDWLDHFENRLRDGMIWGQGLGNLAAQLPDFFLKTTLLVIALWLLHKIYQRPIRNWLTSAPRFRFSHFMIGLVLTGVGVSLIQIVWGYVSLGSEYSPNFLSGPPWEVWVAMAGIVVVTCLNAFGEEVLFRGWAMQQTAAFIRHPVVIIGLPTIAFALAHQDFAPLRLTQLIALGLAFGWAAWRLGGIELASGAHGSINLALDAFRPTQTVTIPATEVMAEHNGISVEQAAHFFEVIPPTTLDWMAYTVIALVPVVVTEAVVWWQKSDRRFQRSRLVAPSS